MRDHADSRSDSDKLALEYPQRAKFMVRDMFARWKVIDKEDRKYKRLQEKQEVEQIRLELEMQEASTYRNYKSSSVNPVIRNYILNRQGGNSEN